MKTQPYNNPPAGCYFDGAAGQAYNDRRVLRLAISYGWRDADALRLAGAESDPVTGNPVLSDGDADLLSDTVDDAVGYLNDLETRSFMFWRWRDGDFILSPDVESAQDDCDFVSSRRQDYPDDDYEGEWLHVSDHGNATLYVRENGQDREVWSKV